MRGAAVPLGLGGRGGGDLGQTSYWQLDNTLNHGKRPSLCILIRCPYFKVCEARSVTRIAPLRQNGALKCKYGSTNQQFTGEPMEKVPWDMM